MDSQSIANRQFVRGSNGDMISRYGNDESSIVLGCNPAIADESFDR
jgi:hypothetical protein